MEGLLFQLSMDGAETMVFCADSEDLVDKWTETLRVATTPKDKNTGTQANGVQKVSGLKEITEELKGRFGENK